MISPKRTIDLAFGGGGLIILSPVLLVIGSAIWLADRGSPFYRPYRVGLQGQRFRMWKFRTMVLNADQIGPSSTGNHDPRITRVGRFMRAHKLDELAQLINVVSGEMSLSGPRPQIAFEVASYTTEERRILSAKPGITDFSSIVFSDEGEILEAAPDPDLTYRQLIRPWKSRLEIFYVDNQTLTMDLALVVLTVVNVVSRSLALRGVQRLLTLYGADETLKRISRRDSPLVPAPPPGMSRPISCAPDRSATLPPIVAG